MHNKRRFAYLTVAGVILVIGSVLWLGTAQPASAQCGSQASSCKNCHEVQGEDPVNSDGTAWHQSHAFGDFCYICHAGNNQAVEKDAAHTGMEDPLANVQASCQQCHPSDLTERAQVYASALGVEIGSAGGGGDASAASGSDVNPTSDSPTNPSSSAIVLDEPDIDYVQQYDETVLGQKTVNWGDIILNVLMVVVIVGGSIFVYFNEKRLRAANKPAVPKTSAESTPIRLEDYNEDVIALLPKIAALNPVGRKALNLLLDDPDAASELLRTLSRIDATLIRRVKTLDRDEQALLLALAGD